MVVEIAVDLSVLLSLSLNFLCHFCCSRVISLYVTSRQNVIGESSKQIHMKS